ncbi:hypothetical protein [Alkalicoccus daliensis]|uniref:Lipoprotein n=1 Tax=Alkalicoccus daliensis TaxID=745820 RepID=A0A1H0HVJ6_9BACI|nr:hypothetical protein [Alkalicoccus daliensis]SDO22781.1 hypothetical protein SAMN04488053_10946 [Alkalicoccus daliensis]
MKKSALTIAALAVVPMALAACSPENEENNNTGENVNEQNENAAEENAANTEDTNAENENSNEEEAGGEAEDLAAEYDLELTTEEGDGSAPEISQEELEEVFMMISNLQEGAVLPFEESPQAGEIEESGEAEGHYLIPGTEESSADPRMTVSFSYEMGGDLEDESRVPSFEGVDNAETNFEGPDYLTWNESSVETEITRADTAVEFTAAGEWMLEAEYEGETITLNEPSEWIAEYGASTLAGIE